MHIRVPVGTQKALAEMVEALSGAGPREVFEAFESIGGVDALEAIEAGAHKSASSLAGYALRIGVEAIARGFERAGLVDPAQAKPSEVPAVEASVEPAQVEGLQPDPPAPVEAKPRKPRKPRTRPLTLAEMGPSPGQLRQAIDARLDAMGPQAIALADACCRRAANWTPRYVAVIVELRIIASTNARSVAVRAANNAGILNTVQKPKGFTSGTLRNHVERLEEAAVELGVELPDGPLAF